MPDIPCTKTIFSIKRLSIYSLMQLEASIKLFPILWITGYSFVT